MKKPLIALLSFFFIFQTLPAQATVKWIACTSGLANTNASAVTIDVSVSGKCIITFKTGQTFTIPVGVTSIEEALIVGGGGGGGFNNNGGGGGGGEVKYRKTSLSLSGITQLKVTVGDGGLDGWRTTSDWTLGENGSPSFLSDQSDNLIIKAGGGGGGCGASNYQLPSSFSGSAGGACSGGLSQAAGNALVDPTAGWERYAKAGGPGSAGGGGGAGVAATGVNGGNGISLSGGIFSGTYGGGGGGWSSGATGGTGGGGTPISGSGYASAGADRANGTDGTANTGGGGGAAKWGGSGVVKLMYSIPNYNQTITLSSLGTSSKTYSYSQVLSMSTSGSVGSGAITYAITAGGNATGCALSNSSSTATITASTSGTCLVSATIAADAYYNTATSSALTFTFSKASQSALSISSTSGSFGTPLTLATNGGSGGGLVTFVYAAGTTTCTLSSGVLTPAATGTCLVTATKATDDNYSAISSSQTTITFAAGSTTATITIADGSLIFRQAKLLTASASVVGKVTFRVNNKILPGCKNKSTTGSAPNIIATCSYRPSTRGFVTISVTLNPADPSYIGTVRTSDTYFVNNRSGSRGG
jgi:hypothetical protein